MLRLFLGRQKFGKTEKCLEFAKERVNNGNEVIMLVPEQYSFQCQRHLLEELGESVSNCIQIHSFTSLCKAICDEFGGNAGFVVDDDIRYLLVGQAIKNVSDNLILYRKYFNSSSFIKQMVAVITEFKQSSVSVESLELLSKSDNSKNFNEKLHDIALILSAYDALLCNRFLEQFDMIEHSIDKMGNASYFKNKTVIVDEFKGFTKSQYNLLKRMLLSADDVAISFCCDSLESNSETDIFNNVKESARRIYKYASDNGIKIELIKLNQTDSISQDVKVLELYLSGNSKNVFEGAVDNIHLISAANVYDEVESVLSTIKNEVRNGRRYKDFAIISRSESKYSNAIEELSQLYDVPCFTDKRVPVMSLPFSVLILSLVKSAVHLESEEIFKFIKTGLLGISDSDISLLENYVYLWSINGNKWLNKWDMNPEGLSNNDNPDLLTTINELRVKITTPILEIRKSLKGNVLQVCKALFVALENISVTDNLSKFCNALENKGYLQESEYQKTGYDIAIKTLDKIVLVMGEEFVSGDEFIDILSNILNFGSVGEIPKTLDQVTYGTADRIKPFRPKIVFVLGVNQDVFPAAIPDSGLLSASERETLRQNNIEVADHSVEDCIEEKFLLYFSCTCAFEQCYISFCNSDLNGSTMAPSSEIIGIKDNFKNIVLSEYSNHLDLNKLETKELAFKKLAENFNDFNDSTNSLISYFQNDPLYESRIKSLFDAHTDEEPKIAEETALKLYGDSLSLSATKADDFSGCKFLYFCKYGIGAKELEKVDFNSLTRGNIVHYCLEKFVKNHFNDIGTLNADSITDEINELCNLYIAENGCNVTQFDDKFRYMLQLVKDTVVVLAKALNNEFSVSSFRPMKCELRVGEAENVEYIDGVTATTDNGHKVSMVGYIDRVDVSDKGKVRVVDYKTGTKGDDFKLSEILNGQNLQMLLYLHSVLENGKKIIKASIPAGVLYFPAKRFSAVEGKEFVRMNGIILDDCDTLSEMEPSLNGDILPVKLRKGSTDKFTSNEPLVSQEAFTIIFKYIERILQEIGNKVLGGDITPLPLKSGEFLKCEYCQYYSVCRFDKHKGFKESLKMKNSDALAEITKRMKEDSDGD